MANKQRGRVAAPYNDGEIEVALTLNVLCGLQDAFGGVPLDEVFASLDESAGIDQLPNLRKFFREVLKSAIPEADLDDAGNWVADIGWAEIGPFIERLVKAAGLEDKSQKKAAKTKRPPAKKVTKTSS